MKRQLRGLAAALRGVLARRRQGRARPVSPMEAVFTEIHRTNGWRDPESASGPGSGVGRTALIRQDLAGLLARLRVESLLDAGCGDFNWMKAVELPLRYVGVDVVPALIEANQRRYAHPGRDFQLADVTADALPRVDLILCRDCLVHLPLREVSRALANFRRSGATYLLVTTFLRHRPNVDIPLGSWQALNLEETPFDFPPPLAAIDERCPPDRGEYADKRLALWRLVDLPG